MNNHYSFKVAYSEEGGKGKNLEVVFWYSLYLGYLELEIFSVSPVDPKNSRCSSTQPTPVQFNPALLTENKNITYHIEISQKKLGCLLYLNSPSVANPILYLAGNYSFEIPIFFKIRCFSLWNTHCCWSAIHYTTNKTTHTTHSKPSTKLNSPLWDT